MAYLWKVQSLTSLNGDPQQSFASISSNFRALEQKLNPFDINIMGMARIAKSANFWNSTGMSQ